MGLFILRIVLEQVLRHVVDRIFRFILFLRQSRKRLQDQGDHSLVEIGANGDGLETVLG